LDTSILTKTVSVKSTQFSGLRPSSKGNENGVRETVSYIMYFISFSDSKGIIKTISIAKPMKSHTNLQKKLFGTLLKRQNKSEDKKPRSAEFKTKIMPRLVPSF
jgi:hypothetical protein